MPRARTELPPYGSPNVLGQIYFKFLHRTDFRFLNAKLVAVPRTQEKQIVQVVFRNFPILQLGVVRIEHFAANFSP
jgi:hypothetical protein